MNRKAHRQNSDITCVQYSYDNNYLLSRSSDCTMKLWDIRNFSKDPVVAIENLPNDFAETSCGFSPNDRMIFTGLSSETRGGPGYLSFYDKNDGKQVTKLHLSDSSIVRSLWHPKLNQIVATCADGKIKMLFDEKRSLRGACLCVVRPIRKVKQQDVMFAERIITPFALPMFKEERQRSTKIQLEKMRQDPKKTKRPDLPMAGPGSGGRIAKQGATLHQWVIQNLEIRKPSFGDSNPREAILRHATEEEITKQQQQQQRATSSSEDGSKKPRLG